MIDLKNRDTETTEPDNIFTIGETIMYKNNTISKAEELAAELEQLKADAIERIECDCFINASFTLERCNQVMHDLLLIEYNL